MFKVWDLGFELVTLGYLGICESDLCINTELWLHSKLEMTEKSEISVKTSGNDYFGESVPAN